MTPSPPSNSRITDFGLILIRPVCVLERVPLDLRNTAARRGLFQRLGDEAKRVLVVSEGLIIYFEADGVAELACDLAAPSNFRRWVLDLASPALLKMLQKSAVRSIRPVRR